MKPFTAIAAFVFSIISLAHLLRLFFGWEVIVNKMTVPLWLSLPVFLITGGLALMLWRESQP